LKHEGIGNGLQAHSPEVFDSGFCTLKVLLVKGLFKQRENQIVESVHKLANFLMVLVEKGQQIVVANVQTLEVERH
jgi:hypothetical protein